jgi:hypothetical protein
MPDRKRQREQPRPEFEVAWYTKEMGAPLQREMLQQQLTRLSSANAGAKPGEEARVPPPEPPAAGEAPAEG